MLKKSLLTLLSLLLLGIALYIVKGCKIGPVVYTISKKHGWGIHSGDFLSLLPLLGAAVALKKACFFKQK